MPSQETPKGETLQEHALWHVLAESGVGYELIPHTPTQTAKAEAEAIGVAPDEVAKTVVVRTPAGYARIVVPASEHVDLAKVRELLASNGETRLATEPELAAAYPEFELGAVPPLGGPAGDSVIIDRRLSKSAQLVFEAGTHDESVRMSMDDILRLTHARLEDVCEH